jgi:hypothetical protein
MKPSKLRSTQRASPNISNSYSWSCEAKYTGSRVKPYFDLVKGVLRQAVRDKKLTVQVKEVYEWLYWELKELKDMEE